MNFKKLFKREEKFRGKGIFFGKYLQKSDGVIRYFDVRSPRIKVLCIIIMLICFAFVVVALFPAVWLFLNCFKDLAEYKSSTNIMPESFDWLGIKSTWDRFGFTRFYINSGIVVLGSTVCAVIFNGLLAYGLAILKPVGYKVLNTLVMWCLMIPSTASIVALFFNISKLGLTNNFLPLWLCFGANAFWVVLFKQFFEGLPKELIEAAQLDGCGPFQIFYKIVLPLSKPIISVIIIFAIVAAWSDFLLPYLVLRGSDPDMSTVMVKLFSFRTLKRITTIEILQAVLFSIIPPTIFFLIFQKKITDGAAAGAVKG